MLGRKMTRGKTKRYSINYKEINKRKMIPKKIKELEINEEFIKWKGDYNADIVSFEAGFKAGQKDERRSKHETRKNRKSNSKEQ